jgi:hypothetical protein
MGASILEIAARRALILAIQLAQEISSMLGFLFFANPIAYSGLKLAAEMRHAVLGLRGEAHDILMVLFYPI